MAEDLGRSTAAPSRIVLSGVEYRVAKMGPRIYGELTQFLKAFVPDPRLKAREICQGLSDKVALQAWTELSLEAKSWPPSPDSEQGAVILTTTLEGATQVVYSLLRGHNGDITLERARAIADVMTVEEVSELIRLAMPEPDFRPKAPGDGATTATPDRGPVPR